MITDFAAFFGHWPFAPLAGDFAQVVTTLRQLQVQRLFLSPLEAAWCRNPHQFNAQLYDLTATDADLLPVPILDPSLPTWRQELAEARRQPKVHLVRLFPAYGGYALSAADELLRALADAGLGVIVQTRLEDTRRQHPQAQVADVPALEVADAASRHPGLSVVLGGARTGEVRALCQRLLNTPNLWVETSQLDGTDALRLLCESGLSGKLLLGTHTPFFVPRAGLVRILTDLPDPSAQAILSQNADALLRRLAATG